jgi:hypothetical protein
MRFHDSVSEQHRRQARDQGDPPQAPQYSSGNSAYVCTLPTLSGNYEIEDDGGDLVRINRVDDDGTRTLAVALPNGGIEYSATQDENGFHIFSKPAGEPDRQPLTGDVAPVALGYGYRSHAQALIDFNARQGRKYGQQPSRRPVPGEALTTVGQYVTDRAKNTAGLRRINEANRQFWNGGRRK